MSYECLQCESAWSHPESFFCSPECRDQFAAESDGPVRCDNCSREEETKAEAVAAGWVHIENDPEGYCWNQQGTCPACQNLG